MTPALTLNAGVRWELQLPIEALNANYSTATVADICGPSGVGRGPGGRACNLFQPGRLQRARQTPQYTQYAANTAGLQDRLEQLRAERERGVAAERADRAGCARSSAIPSRRRSAPASPWPTTATAWPSSRTSTAATRADRISGQPEQHHRQPRAGRASTWPLLYRETDRLGPPPPCTAPGQPPAAFPTSPVYPILATTATNMNIFDPEIQLSYTKSLPDRLPARAVARTWRSKSATSATRTATAGRRRTGTRSTSTRTGSSTSSSWRRRTCASHVAAGCGTTGQAACTFAYRGPGTGTSPLPIYLAHFNAQNRANAGNAALYTGTNWTNTTFIGRLNQLEPARRNNARRTTCSAARRSAPTCWPPGCRRTSG